MNIKIHKQIRIRWIQLAILGLFCMITIAAMIIGSSCSSEACQPVLPGENNDWGSKIVKEREFDFGEVQLGSSAKHSFELINTTDQALKIKSVSASCGCTVAKMDNYDIAPGESAKIVVSLNTVNFRGKKTSTIFARFEEPADEEIQLSVSVNIRNLLVEPETVEFKQVAIDQIATRTVVISRGGSPYWKINNVESTSPSLKAKIIRRKIKGNKVTYEVECSLSESSPTTRQEHVVIETNDSNERSFSIPVSIEVAPTIQVSQSVIDFSDLLVGKNKLLIVKTHQPSTITDMKVEGEGFSVSELKPDKKTSHILQVVRESDIQQQSRLTITTDISQTSVEVELLALPVKDSPQSPAKQRP